MNQHQVNTRAVSLSRDDGAQTRVVRAGARRPVRRGVWPVAGREFTVLVPEDNPPQSPIIKQALGKLAKAVAQLEKHLDQYAAEQAQEARVTVQNRFLDFEHSYRFFREHAATEYGSPPPDPVVLRRGPDGEPTSTTFEPWKRQNQGGYYAGAMMNTYFSRTEHFLVLAAAFSTDFDLRGGGLLSLIGAQWSGKMQSLFNLGADSDANRIHERIKRVRDSLRNPLAHGGFESGHGSLFFHVSGAGALPARMTRTKDGFHYLFTPVTPRSFQDIVKLFDEFDAFLSSRLPYAWRWGARRS